MVLRKVTNLDKKVSDLILFLTFAKKNKGSPVSFCLIRNDYGGSEFRCLLKL